MKKYFISALVFLFPYAAHAETTYFNGFYVGLGVGTLQESVKIKNDSFDATTPRSGFEILFVQDTATSSQSALGNLNIGYSKLINPKNFIALEAHVNIQSTRNHLIMNTAATPTSPPSTIFGSEITIKQTSPSYGLAIKPGILLTPMTALYGILGTELAKFDVNSQAHFFNGPSASTSGSITTNRFGFLVGAGFESYVLDKLKLGLEYNYINFGSIKSPNPSTNFPASQGTLHVQSKLKPQSNALILKLTYHI